VFIVDKRILSMIIAFAMVISLFPVTTVEVEASTAFVISNPYEHVNWNTYKQYKYSHHTHTSNSDGNSSTRTVAEDHYRMGYNILAFTDHDFTHINPNIVRTASPLSMSRIAEMQANRGTSSELRGANSDAKGEGMLFVPNTNERSGLTFPEIDSRVQNVESHHVNTFWSSLPRVSGESIASLAGRLSAEGTGFAIINHPGRNTGSQFEASRSTAQRIANDPNMYTPYANLLLANPYILGFEIINKFDTETQAERILWDNVLQITMPRGRPVWGFSGDDSHHSRAIGFAYNLMLMPELSLSELRYAKESGAFFGFSRVDRQYQIHPGRIETWHWSGVDMSSSQAAEVHALPVPEISSVIVNGDTITINASGHEFINWYADGVLIHNGPTLDLTAHSASINSYVRASVGHRSRGVLYTQPFGIQRAGQTRALPTLQSVTQPTAYTTPWGHQSEMGFALPANVPITVRNGTTTQTRPAPVIWNLRNTGYNPAIRDRDQTFTVNGTVRLDPRQVANPNNVSLNVSVRVTMRAVICTDCSPRTVLVWAPTFTAGQNPESFGIQLGDPANSTLSIAANSQSGVVGLHLTSTNGTYKPFRIHSAPGFAGWNSNTGFAAVANAEYRVEFNASLSRNTQSENGIRMQNRVGSQDAMTSVNVTGLSVTPTTVRHEWRQEGIESFNIDTRNTSERVAIMIENIRIFKLYRCNGNCDTPDRFTKCSCASCASGIVTPPVTTVATTTAVTPPTTPATTTSRTNVTTTATTGGSPTSPTTTTTFRTNTTASSTTANSTTANSTTASNSTVTNTTANTVTSPSNTTLSQSSSQVTTASQVTTTSPATSTTTSGSPTAPTTATTGGSVNTEETTANTEETTANTEETTVNTEETTVNTEETTVNTEETTVNTEETTETTETTPSERVPGDITDTGTVTITDALEILKFLAGLTSLVHETENPAAWEAALITPESKEARRPAIIDVLEILKHLAGLPSMIELDG